MRIAADRRGFLLLEVAVTYIVTALLIAALVPIFLLAVKANARSEETLTAAGLAQELLEEVRLRRWDETTPRARPGYPAYAPAGLGTDAGEDPADKRTFDDVDDFAGWSEAPARDPVMRAWEGSEAFRRSVAVAYVDASLAPAAGPTDYKRVTVCAEKPGAARACLDWIAANR